ncbi:hypothetical protein BS47DRAFT_1340956 [Hydnum rufescens UP504]|uniref:Uncharacterized protein n=1 Tax=Hydnum rufescens UP504 TaxID=1448309 RepID=A0A9P6B2S6_9AGAM|nr:hypothetical protein BS47DRAFT_1340956 [Hydnum rufescens UP504]
MAQELATSLASHPGPTTNQAMHSYAGYGLEKRQSQAPSTSSAGIGYEPEPQWSQPPPTRSPC